MINAGIGKKYETSALVARVSRDNTTNSFGGLNQVDRYVVGYNEKLSSLWRYRMGTSFSDITGISAGTQGTDRQVYDFQTAVFYSFYKNWRLSASYSYLVRRFKSDVSDTRAPSSNKVYIGLTYNFLPYSTF